MKPKSTYLFNLTCLLLLAAVLQSCTEHAGIWKNDQIKTGKRDDFHALTNEVFTSLKANDLNHAKLLMSKELIENTYTERLVEIVGNHLNDAKYSLLDEYYVVNKYIDTDTIKATGRGINNYELYYAGTTREMYFAFFVPKTGDNKSIVTIIFAKYDYGWKLSDFDVAPYTINGKTAPELFKLAKEQYDKKYLINAVNNMALATACLNPITIWRYPDESDISKFYAQVINEANAKYKFPFVLNAVSTRPMILRVYNQATDNGSFPMVYYLSHISLKDTNAIKKENTEIKKVLSEVMPGIDKDNKYVFYDAFNERPTGKKTVDHFDMTDKLQ
jgi:hypothetical protein